MATNSLNTNLEMSSERVVAFFRVQQDAFRAISELKEAGFTSDEIGLMSQGEGSLTADDARPISVEAVQGQGSLGGGLSEAHLADVNLSAVDHPENDRTESDHSESMWEKLKHFFGGESTEDVNYRDSAAGMSWDKHRGDHYYRGLKQGGALVTVTGPRVEEAKEILQDAGADLRHEGFENQGESFADREAGLDAAGTGVEEINEIDEEGAYEKDDDEDIDAAEHAELDRDYRIQVRGEVLRTFRERLNAREVGQRAEPLKEESQRDVAKMNDTAIDDDLDLDDRGNKLRKPAA
jgi:hypothetical protein